MANKWPLFIPLKHDDEKQDSRLTNWLSVERWANQFSTAQTASTANVHVYVLFAGTSGPLSATACELPYRSGGRGTSGTFTTPPIPQAAGAIVTAGFVQNHSATATLTVNTMEIGVCNLAGTQRLAKRTAASIGKTLAPGASWVPAAVDLPNTPDTAGADLTFPSDGTIRTTAGGIFISYAWVDLFS